jgi:hypothetical protein
MTNWNRKARWMTGSLVVAGTLCLPAVTARIRGPRRPQRPARQQMPQIARHHLCVMTPQLQAPQQLRKICTIAWKQISGRGWITTTCGWGQA